jgi:Na+-transporting NADH:ubiquinone oxidoreductase subunit B
VFFGKELFGGTGRNLFNPAILGRCFLALAYPKIMAEAWIAPGTGLTGNMFKWMSVDFGPDAVTVATPLGLAKTGAMITELPKMIMGNIPGSMAETCAVMVILGGVFLVLTKVANWRSIVSTIGSALIMATVLYMIDSERFITPVWHLFAGSLLFGAFFMATDPVSSPSTNAGKWIYGAIIGMTAMLLRNFGNYPEGMMFGILLGNIFAPIIDELIFTIRLRRLANEG